MSTLFGDPISVYPRAQALEDGVLVDVTSLAAQVGLRYPVALTRAVWNAYVEVPAGVVMQDVQDRLWDILWMLRLAVTRGGTSLLYTVSVRNDNRRPRPVRLRAVCGPGDAGKPVITVMLPTES